MFKNDVVRGISCLLLVFGQFGLKGGGGRNYKMVAMDDL